MSDKKLQDDMLTTFSEKTDFHPNLPIVEELQSINENLKNISEKETPEPPEIQKVQFMNENSELAGAFFSLLKGKDGKNGEDGKDGERGQDGQDGAEGKEGKPGQAGANGQAGEDGENGKDGINGENGKDGSPDTGEEIISKINEAEGLIKPERVEGLAKFKKEVSESISNIPRGGARASHSMIPFPLTPNGVTKTFLVPKSVNGFLLSSDNLPNVLMENNGYTINATRTQIVLTTTDAPTSGSQLLYVYSSQFNT